MAECEESFLEHKCQNEIARHWRHYVVYKDGKSFIEVNWVKDVISAKR